MKKNKASTSARLDRASTERASRRRDGFTLIELLVVIAIVGVLSSVVLASVNQARDKGADAAIKADLKGIINQSAIYYDTNGDYGLDFAAADCPVAPTGSGTIFEDDSVAAQQIADAMQKGGSQATCASGNGVGVPNGSAASSWAISVPFKSDPTQSWCVDSNGSSKIIADPAVITIDAAFNAVCP